MIDGVRKNQEVWESLYKSNKADLLYPSDALIRLTNYWFRDLKPRKVLDYGFGTAANLIYLVNKGLEVSGLEISDEAIRIAKSRLEDRHLSADLRLTSEGAILPWEGGYFDAVIAWQVLSYNDWDGWRHALSEIDRLLKVGGVFICAIAAPGDISQVNSRSLGNCLYLSGVGGQEGLVLLIPTKKMLQKCFPGWSIDVGKVEYEFCGVVSKHWIITYHKI